MKIIQNLIPAAVLSAVFLMSAGTALATTYSYDSGTASTEFGYPGYDVAELNGFTGTAGVTQITDIQIAFGSAAAPGFVADGVPVTAYLWSDPNGDGNPSDAVVLASISGVTASVDSDTFVDFVLSTPTTITTDNFFVGFTMASSPGYAAGYDETTDVPGVSWFAAASPGTLDANNLSAASVIGLNTTENIDTPGNFLIRAQATTVPEPATTVAWLGAGALGLACWQRRGKKAA